MDWILTINEKREFVTFEEGYQKALNVIRQRFVNEIPVFMESYINKGGELSSSLPLNELKGLTNHLLNQDNNDVLQDELLNRIGDDIQEEILLCSHNIKSTFEFFFSIGESYVHTNFFNRNASKVFYFKYEDYISDRLGFFNKVKYSDCISLMPLDYGVIVGNLTSRREAFGDYLKSNKEALDELHNVVHLLPNVMSLRIHEFFYSSLICRKVRRHISQDYIKAILIRKEFTREYERENDYINLKYCFSLGTCYLKLKKDVDAVIYLKEGAGIEKENNLCCYKLGLLCQESHFDRLKDSRGRYLLNRCDAEDYLKRAGALAYNDLGDLYLSRGHSYQAIHECYAKSDSVRYTKGFAYLLEGEFDTALDIFSNCYIDPSKLQPIETAALWTGVAILEAHHYIDEVRRDGVSHALYDHPVKLANKYGLWKHLFFQAIKDTQERLPERNLNLDYLLANYYLKGFGTFKNPEEAFRLLNRWYFNGTRDLPLLHLLHDLYERGLGTTQNLEEAHRIEEIID